jgi:DNA-binding transcriptional MerR regulator
MNVMPPLLTSQVARLLDVAPETIRLWERQGILPAVKTDKGVRLFDRRDVERLAREREERRATQHSEAPSPLAGVA